MQNYYTLAKETSVEIEIKKSKFIGYLKGTASEAEAVEYIAAIKKQHREATHHCSAFRIAGAIALERYDDDGEPSKTAGLPMLSVLQGRELWNVTAVVVRYFGGTLLGTGGLTRAYSEAVRESLADNPPVYRQLFAVLALECPYNWNDKVSYELERQSISTGQIDYSDKVEYELFVEKEKAADFIRRFQELTEAQARITQIGEQYGYYFAGKLITG
ncbi:YigZ family protein [Lachnospiraceae bacterium oral taxon 500]|nr:YigZ family protein [Lachnospiraceae bacterium oral taxon 500]